MMTGSSSSSLIATGAGRPASSRVFASSGVSTAMTLRTYSAAGRAAAMD